MDEIKRQVGRAHRRLVFQQFLFVVGWSLFATLLIAAIGLAIPRIWVLVVDRSAWDWSWIGGGIAAGFMIAGLWTWMIRRSRLDAAIELDRRFGLKERVSSTLALGPEELETDIGQALVTDAVRRVERIDVREQFQVKPTWRALLPLLPAAAMAGVLYFGFATQRAAEATSQEQVAIKQQIKTATVKLQEKIRETEKKAAELGLKDADALKEINKELDKLANKTTADRKDAMLKINDLAKEIERRKQELGGADKMKKELDKLKDIQNGPADKLKESLKEGDFGKAQEQMKQMKEDLKAGKLSDEDKEKLAKQMEQMKDALKQGIQDAKEAREQLQREIEKKLEEGNIAEAAKLQQQLDKMNENAEQMEQQMDQLANKLGDLAKALQEGDSKAAAQKLDELAQDLDQLQEQLDQIENLNEVLDQLADAKNAMKCDQCDGAGCKACEGSGKEGEGKDGEGDGKGKGKGKNKGKGRGLGSGQGEGERPEEETDKSFYDTKVNADAKAGEAVRVGDAGGNNIAGRSKESVKEAIQGALAKDPDALEDVNLPRDQREHAKQYFEKFRKGE